MLRARILCNAMARSSAAASRVGRVNSTPSATTVRLQPLQSAIGHSASSRCFHSVSRASLAATQLQRPSSAAVGATSSGSTAAAVSAHRHRHAAPGLFAQKHTRGSRRPVMQTTRLSALPSPAAPTTPALVEYDDCWLLAPVRSAVPRALSSRVGFVLIEGVICVGPYLALELIAKSWSTELVSLLAPLLEATSQWMEPLTLILALQNSAVIVAYLALTRVSARLWPSLMRAPAAAGGGSSGSSGSSTASTRAPTGWLHTLLWTGAAFVVHLALNFGVWLLWDGPVEEPLLIEESLDGRGVSASIVFVAPLTEEIAFRGLLFARCVRFLGFIPALLINGVSFGLAHHSDMSDKVLQTGVGGAVKAVLYASTQRLLAPIAAHALWNYHAMGGSGDWSPMLPLDSVASTMDKELRNGVAEEARDSEAKRFVLRLKTALGLHALRSPSSLVEVQRPKEGAEDDFPVQPAVPTKLTTSAVQAFWLTPDGSSLQPAAERLTADLFHMLDRGQKGYLSPDELAWFVSLHPDVFVFLNAAIAVIDKRVTDDEAVTQLVRANMDRMPSTSPLEWPSDSFFTPEQQAYGVSRFRSTYGWMSQQPGGFDERVLNVQLQAYKFRGNPEPVDDATIRMQNELIGRYYTLYWRAYHRANFPSTSASMNASDASGSTTTVSHSSADSTPFDESGCTLPRFQESIVRDLLLNPVRTGIWLNTTLACVQPHWVHFVAQLLEAREQNQDRWMESTEEDEQKLETKTN